MFLTAGPVPGFLSFFQILCWIILPILASAVLIAIVLHYRKRKKEAESSPLTEQDFMEASPEQVGYTRGDGEYILFDHSGLIMEYKKRLSYHHARNTALQQDFLVLESKYKALAGYAGTQFLTSKNKAMENYSGQLPNEMRKDIERLSAHDTAERKDIQDRLEQLSKSYQRLEQENEFLQQQINVEKGTEEEKLQLINHWREQHTVLRDKMGEQEYIKDMLEEKSAQVVFLQNQLEQRIRTQHQSEQLRLRAEAGLQQSKEDLLSVAGQVSRLQNELLQKQEEADRTQIIICEKEEQLVEKRQIIMSRLDHITYLENTLSEVRQQNELLNAEAADKRDQVEQLQYQLADEHSKLQFAEEKLVSSRQTMRRLHKEFTACLGEEAESSPVIVLRPDYITRENSETALQ